jgi:ankyrin repeat protein
VTKTEENGVRPLPRNGSRRGRSTHAPRNGSDPRFPRSLCVFVSLCFLTHVSVFAADLVGLRLIVVRTESEAAALLTRLQAGEKFDELARKHSIDSTASAGGYLGTFTVEQLRPEFQSALQGLSPGENSRVVRIGREFALVQLLTIEETRAIELKNGIDAPRSPTTERLWTMAIAANDSSIVKKLLDSGADFNAKFGDGSTVLMGAAQAGQMEIVRALLAAGASVNAQTRDGTTALVAASQAGHAQIVRVLIDAAADVNARKTNGGTALIDAAFGGHVETVRVLLESHADANISLQDGSTALMASAGKGYNDIVRALLQSGAQVNAGFDTGGTALMEAAYAGQAEVVRILLAAGADPKFASPTGLTALMGAALGGHTSAVQALLDAGARTSPRDAKGWTALTYARASANSTTVRVLLNNAKDISAEERSIPLGSTYINEYYSSNDANLLEMATAEFQKVLKVQPQNVEALEWMGAVEFLRWNKPPTLEQFRKAESFLKKSADLDPKDPDRHYWLAAISSMFVSNGTGASPDNISEILEQGIQHANKAIELDPQFADAMDHLSALYHRKADVKMADAAHQNAMRIREKLRNRPSRFNDQFSRPAVPPAPQN